MGIAARLTIEEAEELTRAPRTSINADGTIRGAAEHNFSIVVQDLSETGCLLETGAEMPIGSVVTLRIAGFPQRAARIARRDGARYGCEFLTPMSRDELNASRDLETLHRGARTRPSPARIMLAAAAVAVAVAASWPGLNQAVMAILWRG